MNTQTNHDPRQSNRPLTILRVDASARGEGSISRELGDRLVGRLRQTHGDVEVVVRDLREGIPFVDEAWMGASFTPEQERSEDQRAALVMSDALVEELRSADVLVIGTPIYNFGVPAALKAWIDMVARARLTFRYTEQGPVGLLEGKKAYVLVASGGTPVGSDIDFASGYLRHVLGFLGIHDVELIAADRLVAQAEVSIAAARERIDRMLPARAA
jgi:FMN-dependent NADH-azoreductase